MDIVHSLMVAHYIQVQQPQFASPRLNANGQTVNFSQRQQLYRTQQARQQQLQQQQNLDLQQKLRLMAEQQTNIPYPGYQQVSSLREAQAIVNANSSSMSPMEHNRAHVQQEQQQIVSSVLHGWYTLLHHV